MMKLTATVEYQDGRKEEKRVFPFSVCEAERHLGKSFHRIIGDNYQNELLWLCWHAHTGGGVEFEPWLRGVSDATVVVGDVADPTNPAPTPG